MFEPILAKCSILYPLMSENLWFPDVFMGYRKETLGERTKMDWAFLQCQTRRNYPQNWLCGKFTIKYCKIFQNIFTAHTNIHCCDVLLVTDQISRDVNITM